MIITPFIYIQIQIYNIGLSPKVFNTNSLYSANESLYLGFVNSRLFWASESTPEINSFLNEA